MVNRSVNEFNTCFLFKMGALPHDVVFPLDIDITFFNSFSPEVRYLLTSEGFQVPPWLTTGTNHQGNQRLLLVGNAAG